MQYVCGSSREEKLPHDGQSLYMERTARTGESALRGWIMKLHVMPVVRCSVCLRITCQRNHAEIHANMNESRTTTRCMETSGAKKETTLSSSTSSHQQHPPRCHLISDLKTIYIYPAGETAGVECDGVVALLLRFVHQHRYLPTEKIIHLER
jgi:hypothetical protein